MTSSAPLNVVVAGGGVAALEAAMALHDLAGDRVRVTLVAPEPEFELKALRTAEPFAAGHVPRYALAELAARLEVTLRAGTLSAVDTARRTVVLADGAELPYDALVVAVGARPRPAYRRAITFGADDRTELLNALLSDLDGHYSRSVAFIVPPGVTWSLPLYEIALMTAREVHSMGIDDVRFELITPESTPLMLFGPDASDAAARLLETAGIAFRGGAYADVDAHGQIRLMPGGEVLDAERIVALPVMEGPAVDGLPCDEHGFIPIDDHGRVRGVEDVYAAGDGADFPIKQGGLACQQADAIAHELACRAGADVEPEPFRPVLRGRLLTGRGDEYLRHALHGGAGRSQASHLALWYPPAKVSGRYLSRWLARLDAELAANPPAETAGVEVEVDLWSGYARGRDALRLDPLSPVPR